MSTARLHPFFFIPILLGNRVVFLMQIWLSQAGDPKTYQDIVTFLSSLGSQATLFPAQLSRGSLDG